jgi:hypothetical protein
MLARRVRQEDSVATKLEVTGLRRDFAGALVVMPASGVTSRLGQGVVTVLAIAAVLTVLPLERRLAARGRSGARP